MLQATLVSFGITGLFSNATTKSLELTVDATATRHTALAANIANVNTPGYRRVDLSSSFQNNLTQALQDMDAGTRSASASLPQSSIALDQNQNPMRLDENTVDLDKEVTQMMQNSATFEFATRALGRRYSGLVRAITGRSGA